MMSGCPATDFKIPITGRITRKRRAFIKKMEEEKRREEDRKKKKDEEENEYLYLYIVLREHLCRINLTKLLLLEEEPPIETLLDFPDKDLPVGIGAFAFNSNLYLIGGEVLKKGKRLEPLHARSDPGLFKRLSDRMFLYNPHDHRIRQVSSMTARKPCPQVAILDGKLYVIAGQHHCWRGKVPVPRFECYDPTLNLWDTLPDPPFYDDWPTLHLYVSVIGREIFVKCPAGLYAYHVDDRTWTSRSLEDDSPFMFFGHLAESDDDGIVLAYTIRGLVAYKDTTLGCAQVLKELNKAFPSPDMDSQCSFVNYLGDKRYCLLLFEVCGRVTGDLDMHVLLFRVEMLHEGEGDFCSTVLLKHHTYNAYSDIMLCHDYNPTHVFTMYKGPNKKGKDGSDRMSSTDGGSGGRKVKELPQLSKSLQERERIHSPGGNLEGEVVPLGNFPVLDAKPLSKSAKRNRKKKEKRLLLRKVMALQEMEVVPPSYVPVLESAKRNTEKKRLQINFYVSLDKDKERKSEVSSSTEDGVGELVASQINELGISANPSAAVMLVPSSTESSAPCGLSSVDKRLRALRKKMRSLKQKSLLNEEQLLRLEGLYAELISWELILLELRKETKIAELGANAVVCCDFHYRLQEVVFKGAGNLRVC
ncbi:hypothetical protein LguiA_027095 [Lonicera macranthoides]